MNVTNQITSILTACGCKPAVVVSKNGSVVVKVNAPKAKEDAKK